MSSSNDDMLYALLAKKLNIELAYCSNLTYSRLAVSVFKQFFNVKEENIALAIEVLNNLDECVKKAQPWLGHFNLKHDKWYPDALDAGYEISAIYVGTWYHGAPFVTTMDGFTISFSTINYYPEQFTVKYTNRLWPIAVEEWVE